jgi:hypothetical protein
MKNFAIKIEHFQNAFLESFPFVADFTFEPKRNKDGIWSLETVNTWVRKSDNGEEKQRERERER